MAPDLALNTAVSFATNASWQSYGGETTFSYLSQMAGITVQSFLSCATGVAVASALVRSIARRSAQTIRQFWVDLTRITLYVLLPISAAATNGSAFAGLNANTPFYNLTLAAAMFAGRFLVIVPVLAIAGTLAGKLRVPASAGTLPTHGMQFVALLVGTIVIVGGLSFFPALAVGPVAEQLAMQQVGAAF